MRREDKYGYVPESIEKNDYFYKILKDLVFDDLENEFEGSKIYPISSKSYDGYNAFTEGGIVMRGYVSMHDPMWIDGLEEWIDETREYYRDSVIEDHPDVEVDSDEFYELEDEYLSDTEIYFEAKVYYKYDDGKKPSLWADAGMVGSYGKGLRGVKDWGKEYPLKTGEDFEKSFKKACKKISSDIEKYAGL